MQWFQKVRRKSKTWDNPENQNNINSEIHKSFNKFIFT